MARDDYISPGFSKLMPLSAFKKKQEAERD
jgi:hypothetical protein